jgi:hypothetical protein
MFGLMRISNHEAVINELISKHCAIVDGLADALQKSSDDIIKRNIRESLAENGHVPHYHSLYRVQRSGRNSTWRYGQ